MVRLNLLAGIFLRVFAHSFPFDCHYFLIFLVISNHSIQKDAHLNMYIFFCYVFAITDKLIIK